MTEISLPEPVLRSDFRPVMDVIAFGASSGRAGRRRGALRPRHPRRVLHRRVQFPAGTHRVVVPRSRSRLPSRPWRSAGNTGAPVVSRGGGTSLAGQCTNTAVMIDWAKYCNRLLSVDAQARTCVVEPGIVLDVLNAAARQVRPDVTGQSRRRTRTARSAG